MHPYIGMIGITSNDTWVPLPNPLFNPPTLIVGTMRIVERPDATPAKRTTVLAQTPVNAFDDDEGLVLFAFERLCPEGLELAVLLLLPYILDGASTAWWDP